jgi:hypothetical protein
LAYRGTSTSVKRCGNPQALAWLYSPEATGRAAPRAAKAVSQPLGKNAKIQIYVRPFDALFQAKTAQKAHGYCVASICSKAIYSPLG